MALLLSNTEQKLLFKAGLKGLCIQILEQRIANIEQAINESRESANSEEKSSAGDKYETSRAMGHLSQEMQTTQLEAARHELNLAQIINAEILHSKVMNGSVVVCKDFLFFVAAGLGAATFNGQKVMLLSVQAPLAAAMYQKRPGDSFLMNTKVVEIVDVF